jgi:hypothetical protein
LAKPHKIDRVKIPRLQDIKGISGNKSTNVLPGELTNALLDLKVKELIEVIGRSGIDSKISKHYQQQIADAFHKSESAENLLAPYNALDQDNSMSREELLEGLEKLLSETTIDSNISKNYLRKNTVQKVVMFILSILLIVVGFAMIIMPAPPSFEIFTVFYFTANDGVTIMDLVSLLIIFGGVLLFVLNFNKK